MVDCSQWHLAHHTHIQELVQAGVRHPGTEKSVFSDATKRYLSRQC